MDVLNGLKLFISDDVDGFRKEKIKELFIKHLSKKISISRTESWDNVQANAFFNSPGSVYYFVLESKEEFSEDRFMKKYLKLFRKTWTKVEKELDFLPKCDVTLFPVLDE